MFIYVFSSTQKTTSILRTFKMINRHQFPYWEWGSGSGSIEIAQNLHKNLVFCFQQGLYFQGMFFDLLPTLGKFSCKIKFFATLKSHHDPDLDPLFGSWIRICIEIKSWIRIRIGTNVDSQHCFSGEKLIFLCPIQIWIFLRGLSWTVNSEP